MLIVPPASPGITGGRSAPHPLLLRGARLPDGRIEDVTVADGVIVSVGGNPPGHPSPEPVDLRGYLLLPSLVEPHAHLGLPGPAWATGGALGQPAAGRGRWVTARSAPAMADIAALAGSFAARYLAAGTTAIRVHLDVATEAGLRAVEALLEVRAGLAGILDIQIVAAVSAPLTGLAGTASRALLRQALAAGADLAGAGPGAGAEAERTVEALAVDAAGAGVGLDVHIDESAGPAPRLLGRLIAIAEAGFGHPLTISHLASLGTRKKERRHAERLLASTGIGVVVLPRSGPFRQHGSIDAAACGGPVVVRHLLQAGVPVAAGGDISPEPTSPAGRADPLETASHLVTARLTPAEAITAISTGGRQILGLPSVAVTPGSPADLVAIRAPDLWEAVTDVTTDRIVLRGGRVVARNLATADLARPDRAVARSSWNLPGALAPGIDGATSFRGG